jgi:hypothetical protein
VKRGIIINFSQTGKIGRFSAQVLLVNICSGLGMMALATMIVDTIAIYVLPKKRNYFRHKFKVIDTNRLINQDEKDTRGRAEKKDNHPTEDDQMIGPAKSNIKTETSNLHQRKTARKETPEEAD